ncbi:MAG: hypothetical protein DME38_00145 [Verrucomicrobia bacterium]|nr:MAG: hypothetical protein DME38_00145 [Verrucomicrobiota bacterium]
MTKQHSFVDALFRISSFGFDWSFAIRHSSLIRHSPFVIRRYAGRLPSRGLAMIDESHALKEKGLRARRR